MSVLQVSKENSIAAVKKSRFVQAILKYKYLYLLALPGILFYILFSYVPMYGIILAFKKFYYNRTILADPWVGLANFRFLLKDPNFFIAFKNTIIISFGKILFGFPVPIILALLLNELRGRFYKRAVQSILYMPHFFSWVIVYGIFYSLFSSNSGVISKILLDFFGIKMQGVIGNPDYFRPIIFITDIWKGAGWGTIIYLAAITGINPELYEAAHIDGATKFKQLLHVTLPSLKYAIIILLILNMGGIMGAGFDQVFNFYSPTTYGVGDIIDTYVYRLGIIGSKFEVSTAIGLFKSIINAALLLLADRIAKLFGEEGLI